MDIYSSCSICHQELKLTTSVDNLEVKLKCNHKFHKKCIEKQSIETNSCPVCGKLLVNFNLIHNKFDQRDYIMSKSKCTDYILINLYKYNIKCYKPLLLKQSPQSWIDYPESNTLLPLYTLTSVCNTEIFIDFHLRQQILLGTYDKNTVEIISNIDSNIDINIKERFHYYSSSESILKDKLTYDFSKNISKIVVSWIYDIMVFVSDTYNLVYYNSLNTLIFDLVIMTLNDDDIDAIDDDESIIRFKQKSKLQAIILAALYSSCRFYCNPSIEFNIDSLIFLSDNSTDKEELTGLFSIYNKYLRENFIKI
jgi:hypothetical protein